MTQGSNKGLDSGFIELAQGQLEGVEERLAQIDTDIADLQGERATLIEQRMHLHGIVNPSAKTNGARVDEANVQSTRDAVVELIRKRGEPMHYRKDIYPGLVRAGHEIGGKDPANTLLSRVINDERLSRVAPGVYTLAVWQGNWSESDPARSYLLKELTARTALTRRSAKAILRKAGSPVHIDELTEQVLKDSYHQLDGLARAVGAVEIAKQVMKTGFLQLGDGMIGLRGRDEAAA